MDDTLATLEELAQAACLGLERAIGRPVEIGLHGKWDDEEVIKRGVPIRATVVEFPSPLADCMVGVTTMHDETLQSAMTAVVESIGKDLALELKIDAPQVHEFDDREYALEQLDALYMEPTLHFVTPKGDLLIVVGSGLVETVSTWRKAGGATPAPDFAAGADEGLDAAAEAILAGLAPDSDLPFQADVSGPSPEGDLVTIGTEAAEEEVVYTDDGPIPVSQLTQEQAEAAGVPWMGAGAAAAPAAPPAPTSAAQPPAHAPMPSVPAPAAPPVGALAATAVANAMSATPEMERLLSGVEVELSAELGRTSMALGDITSMHTDSVLTLDQMVDEPVRVYVNGALFGTARLVVVDDEYGIEILEVFDRETMKTEHPLAA
jgi:flagellar motor switch protein FliN